MIKETPLGNFKRVSNDPFTEFSDTWKFECPNCKRWDYLDNDQWNGQVSVDHSPDCTYHETHNYKAALLESFRHD